MTDSRDERLERLSEAVDLYLELADAETRPTAENLLAERPDLRDLLGPVLTTPDGSSESTDSPRYFAGFELLRELGRGGSGIVYEAREAELDRRVALKILGRGPHLTASNIERFRREAAAAGKLQHPHIASVFRVGEHDGTHFIAMEFVEGRNLAAVIRDAGDQPHDIPEALLGGTDFVRDAAKLIATIADALSYAHSHFVVHRDVKPHNIVVSRDGTPRLVDFGLAKDFGRDAMTRTGDTAGTPDYMSPEQVRGEATDPRTDVFSLGVVLYELLTTERPFAAKSAHETLDSILTREPTALRRRNPRIPRDLETICHRAIEKDLDQRYPSMLALADDLQRFLRDEPILATPPSALTRSVKFVRRNRAASLAAVFGLLALVVAPIAFAIHFKLARDELIAEQAEVQRQRDLVASVLTDARETLEKITKISRTRIAATPGMSTAHRKMLEHIVGFHEKVREVGANDPVLALEYAYANSQLGAILGQLGEPEKAESHLRDALSTLRRLIAKDDDPFLLGHLITTHRRAAALASNSDRLEDAQQHLDTAIQLIVEQAADEHDREWIRVEWAATLLERAKLTTRRSGPDDRAGADLKHAAELLSGLEDKSEYGVRIAYALSQRARWLASRGELEAANDTLTQSREWLAPALETESDDPSERRMMLSTLRNQGRVQDGLGDLDLARSTLEEMLTRAQSMARDFPALAANGLLVGGCEYDLGVATARSEMYPEASQRFESAMHHATRAMAKLPNSVHASSLLANAVSGIASINLQTGGNPEAAIEGLSRAAATLETAVEKHSESHPLHLSLGIVYTNLAFGHIRTDDFETADTPASRAVAILSELRDKQPADLETRQRLRDAAARASWCRTEIGDPAGGAEYARIMTSTFPEEPPVLVSAALLLLEAADKTGDSETADSYVEDCVTWLRTALRIAPTIEGRIRKTSKFDRLHPRLGIED